MDSSRDSRRAERPALAGLTRDLCEARSPWAAFEAIAPKVGGTTETLSAVPLGQALGSTQRATSIRTISAFCRSLSNTICLPSAVTSNDCVAAELLKRLS